MILFIFWAHTHAQGCFLIEFFQTLLITGENEERLCRHKGVPRFSRVWLLDRCVRCFLQDLAPGSAALRELGGMGTTWVHRSVDNHLFCSLLPHLLCLWATRRKHECHQENSRGYLEPNLVCFWRPIIFSPWVSQEPFNGTKRLSKSSQWFSHKIPAMLVI